MSARTVRDHDGEPVTISDVGPIDPAGPGCGGCGRGDCWACQWAAAIAKEFDR